MNQRKIGATKRNFRSVEEQVELGIQLAAEKQACFAAGDIWKFYVRETFGLSRERADELIRIGVGVTTVEVVRKYKREQKRLRVRNKTGNEAAKERFVYCVQSAEERARQAKERLRNRAFSLEDIIEMRAALTDLIFEWQHIFDLLK